MKKYFVEIWDYEAVAVNFLLSKKQKQKLQEHMQEQLTMWLDNNFSDHAKRVKIYVPCNTGESENNFAYFTNLSQEQRPKHVEGNNER